MYSPSIFVWNVYLVTLNNALTYCFIINMTYIDMSTLFLMFLFYRPIFRSRELSDHVKNWQLFFTTSWPKNLLCFLLTFSKLYVTYPHIRKQHFTRQKIFTICSGNKNTYKWMSTYTSPYYWDVPVSWFKPSRFDPVSIVKLELANNISSVIYKSFFKKRDVMK